MEPFFQDYLTELSRRHDQMLEAIDGLPQEALDWTPGTDMNSLNVLVTHTAGAERYWIGDVALGEPSSRDRDAEFRVKGASANDLKKRMGQATEFARYALGKLIEKDLDTERVDLRDGKTYRVGYALEHAITHTGLHVGHMQLMRQLWEQKIGR